MDWSNNENFKINTEEDEKELQRDPRRRKKKIKKLPFKIKWQRFLTRNPDFFKYCITVSVCILGTLILLTLLFFTDLYRIDFWD